MPEYSSTTITPSDGVQVPGMNGSTSGNLLLSALRDFILASKGQANGLASLGSDGKLTASQLPDLADDVIVVASYATLPAIGTAGKIYITADNNKMFRWDPDLTTPDYVELSVDLSAYATKAELAAEESARETEDSRLKSAIDANSKRITNLETKAGDEIPVTYPSDTYGMDGVPASVAPYGKVRELIMNSRVRNNLLHVSAMPTLTSNGVTFTSNGDGTITVSGTATGGNSTYSLFTVLNIAKLYLWGGCPSGGSASTFFIGTSASYADVGGGMLRTFPASGLYYISITVIEGTSVNFTCKPYVTDVALYFGTSDLSFLGATDSAKLATIQRDYPELLIPSDYDTGTRVDITYSAVKSVGRNIFDEQTEGGRYDASGNKDIDRNRIRCVNPINVTPNTEYYIKIGNYAGNYCAVFEYDADGNFIQQIIPNASTHLFTTSGNCRYITFFLSDLYGTTYKNDVCINVSDSQDGTYTPYMTDTLTLPTPVTGKSAGSVHQIYYPETGEMTEPLGEYTFTGNEVWTQVNAYCYNASIIPTAKRPADDDVVANIFLGGLVRTSANALYYGTISSGIALGGTDGKIYISASDYANRTSLVGKVLSFELATPDPNSQATDPVLDPFVKVEGNGTIRPVQSQTPQIDSAMSVDYLGV